MRFVMPSRYSVITVALIAAVAAAGGAWVCRCACEPRGATRSEAPVAIDPISEAASSGLVIAACEQLSALAAPVVDDNAVLDATTEAKAGVLRTTTPPEDAEWQTFPRLAFNLATYFRSANGFDAARLFRHRRLNPRDLVIDPTERVVLRDVLGVVTQKVQELRQLQANIAYREATDRHAVDVATVVKPIQGPTTLKGGVSVDLDWYNVTEGDVLLPRNEGGAFLVRSADLPNSRLLREKQLFLVTELVVALVGYFECRGVLTAQEAAGVRDDVVSALLPTVVK